MFATSFIDDLHFMSDNGLWWWCKLNNCWYPAAIVNGKIMPIAPMYEEIVPVKISQEDVPTVLVKT